MAQQQRKFSSRFLPDAKRKSRPKSLPVANNNPIPRSNTNPLTRVKKCLDGWWCNIQSYLFIFILVVERTDPKIS